MIQAVEAVEFHSDRSFFAKLNPLYDFSKTSMTTFSEVG
jgi:hypothetical protein